MKKTSFILLLLALFSTIVSYGQSLHVHFNDESEAGFNVNEVNKITFDTEYMHLFLNDETVYSWLLISIENLQHSSSLIGFDLNAPQIISTNVIMYPNPSSGLLNVEYETLVPGTVTLSLLGIDGKEAYRKEVNHLDQGSQLVSIDLSSFPNGSYQLSLSATGMKISKKLVLKK